MNILLFEEHTGPTTFRMVVLARFAVLLSSPLVRLSPHRIERFLRSWGQRFPAASKADVLAARLSVCSVSRRCRSQEGCLRRSLAVVLLCRMQRFSVTWCTGFAMDPFRAHAWVAVADRPVGEPDEVESYAKVIEVSAAPYDTGAGEVESHQASSSGPSAEGDSSQETQVSVRQLLALARGSRSMFMVASGLGALASALTLAIPFVAGRTFQDQSFELPGWRIMALLALFVGASGLASAVQNYLIQRIGENAVRESRQLLVKRLFLLPIAEYDHQSVGDLLSRVTSDASQLRAGFIQVSIAVTNGTVFLVGGFIAMALVDVYLLGISLVTSGLIIFLLYLLGRWVQFASLDAQKQLGKIASLVERNLVAVRTIRSYNATENEMANASQIVGVSWAANIKLAKIRAVVAPLSNLGVQIAAVLTVGFGFYRVDSGQMTSRELAEFTLLIFILLGPLTQLTGTFSQLGESLGALARIQGILDRPSETDLDLASSSQSVVDQTSGQHPAVAFENVVFGYESIPFGEDPGRYTNSLVLHSLTLQAQEGKSTALVGPSGAGKSTVLQLIERFYDISAGHIRVFGRDIAEYDREQLRDLLAYVEQDAPVLSGTLRENLTLGKAGLSDSECAEAIKQVDLTYVLERSDKGLDQTVGEAGVALSGGERQRLGIARAILSRAPIILLDEATANLDSRSERQIAELLHTALADRTVISVTHRLSTVIDAEVIHVLEHGRVVGSGTHDELLRTVPLYRELAKEQYLDIDLEELEEKVGVTGD